MFPNTFLTFLTCMIPVHISGQAIAISLWHARPAVYATNANAAIENTVGPTVIAVTNVKIAPVAGTHRIMSYMIPKP